MLLCKQVDLFDEIGSFEKFIFYSHTGHIFQMIHAVECSLLDLPNDINHFIIQRTHKY